MIRARTAFRIGSWVALAAAVVSVALVGAAGFVGILALTGKVTYPVDYSLGPLHYQDTLSVDVVSASPVCQEVDIVHLMPNEYPGDGDFCYKLFQGGDEYVRGGIAYQDPDVRPTEALLAGEVQLSTRGSWNPWVAAQVVKKVIVGTVVAVWCFLVWRLLAAAAAGRAFNTRTVRRLRALGWLTIGGALLAPALDHFTSIYVVQGLDFASYGMPVLDIVGTAGYPGGVDLVRVALGGLVLLVAEVFRYGSVIEDERRLTV